MKKDDGLCRMDSWMGRMIGRQQDGLPLFLFQSSEVRRRIRERALLFDIGWRAGRRK